MPHSDDRPVILLGEGARGADLTKLFGLGMPIISSWQACDLIDNLHPLYFGRPGVYGQRCANKILYNADTVISIGCRMSVFTVGHTGLRPEQRLVMVDIDPAELDRFPNAKRRHMTVARFLERLDPEERPRPQWLKQCRVWREMYPYFDASHKSGEMLNAYDVVHELEPLLPPDATIVTDMGVALCAAFQVLRLRPGQRLMTSGGLGEMGCGLPAAIGASFARDKGEVICLHCDGGMSMNVQELQTIVHHQLPIKIIVFENDAYRMIRSTQENLRMEYSGVNRESGVTCPDYFDIFEAYGIQTDEVSSRQNLAISLEILLERKGPASLVVHTDPEQAFSPKLQPILEDGKIRSPTFEELSP